MVAKPENLDRFIFNSDYPTDKIVWLYEGQFNTNSSGAAQYYITGSQMPYTDPPIFVKGMGSIDNWQTSFLLGTQFPISDSYADNTSIMFGNFVDHGKGLMIDVLLRNYANTTVKVRLWGVQREDIPMAVNYNPTSDMGMSKLKLDTYNNYPRLYKEGVAMSGESIQHNLGRTPYVDFWYREQSTLNPLTKENAFNNLWRYKASGHFGDATKDGAPCVHANDTEVAFKQLEYADETRDAFYYYRIYA